MANVSSDNFDVVVVGAGSAGAAVAMFCAEHGMRVLCVDRGDLDSAGARWVNGVAKSAFEQAGIAPPSGDESHGGGATFHLVAGYGPSRLTIAGHEVFEVDMRHLVRRLQRQATERGVRLVGETPVKGIDNGELITDAGRVKAQFFVDASGYGGARLLGQPRLSGDHLCAASQAVFAVTDTARCRAFFDENETPAGEVLCFSGIAGGYSILNVRCTEDYRQVSILTGSIVSKGTRSGVEICRDFTTEQSWIGERIFGGSRVIPVRRPFDRLASDRVAILGDAACQVFPAHGSGVGPGLVAARILADSLASGGGPEDYARTWQRRHGGLLAAYDLFRRFSQTLEIDDIQLMMDRGLMDPVMVRLGLDQQMPKLDMRSAPRKLAALAKSPSIANRLASVAMRMVAVRGLYKWYPKNDAALERWSKTVSRIFGDPPDVIDVRVR